MTRKSEDTPASTQFKATKALYSVSETHVNRKTAKIAIVKRQMVKLNITIFYYYTNPQNGLPCNRLFPKNFIKGDLALPCIGP